MNIKLLSHTEKPAETIYRAYRTCYSKEVPSKIKLKNNEDMKKFIKKFIHHESPLEHCNFTFSIEGVSRSLSHQLVRHRLASYSQQSQRYVNGESFDYVIPSSIAEDREALEAYTYLMKAIDNLYWGLCNVLAIPKEDARYILPNATTTNLVMTMNLREFRHFYAERSCKHAQWEIRELADMAMKEVKKVIPFADYKAKKCGATCFECVEDE